MKTTHPSRYLVAATATVLLVAACGNDSGDGDGTATDPPGADETTGELEGEGTVYVVSHDSFNLDEALIEQFEAESGYTVERSAPGDAGELVNQLILTKNAPLGDVAYGVDNVSAGRAINEGVFAEYTSAALPASAADYLLPGLTPIDRGDVCFNVDLGHFFEAGIDVPETFEDLLQPEYADSVVTTNAATSSPGVAILLATIAEFGEDGYLDYWQQLAGNGLRVASGWSEAYYTDFTAGGEGGVYPVVTSYASSPAYDPTTAAMLDTCYVQVEYAGVLEGAQNPEGAQAFIDFLLSAEAQADIPNSMYMYPIDDSVEVPQEWADNAPLPTNSRSLDADLVTENLQQWIQDWSEVVAS